MKHNYYKAIF